MYDNVKGAILLIFFRPKNSLATAEEYLAKPLFSRRPKAVIGVPGSKVVGSVIDTDNAKALRKTMLPHLNPAIPDSRVCVAGELLILKKVHRLSIRYPAVKHVNGLRSYIHLTARSVSNGSALPVMILRFPYYHVI